MSGRVIHSLELTLDRPSDDAIRSEWAQLQSAGIPSLAAHTGATNRPHSTVVASNREIRLERLPAVALPIALTFSGLLVFGSGRPTGMVLARAVVPTAELLELHAELVGADGASPVATSALDAWMPHVTLARRLDAAALAAALDLLEAPDLHASATGLRLWDAQTRTVTLVAGTA